MRTIGVGVIGCGTFGTLHARLYSEHPLAKLVAVADIDKARADAVARRYGVEAYADYNELLQRPDIEAVSIVVPDHLHRDPCVSAAKAGKHILVEKPLATTIRDAEAIIAAVEQSGVKLMVDFMNRWSPPFQIAKRSIETGELGDLLYVNMKLNDTLQVPTKMLSWASKSSVLWFLGSHAVDLLLWLVDNRVKRVSSLATWKVLASQGIDTADAYHSVLEFENGVVAFLETSWVLPNTLPTAWEFTAEIVGTQGKVDIDTAQAGCIRKFTERSYNYPDVFCSPEIDTRVAGFAALALDHFVKSVVEDKKPPISLEDALRVTEIIVRLEEAAISGKMVEL